MLLIGIIEQPEKTVEFLLSLCFFFSVSLNIYGIWYNLSSNMLNILIWYVWKEIVHWRDRKIFASKGVATFNAVWHLAPRNWNRFRYYLTYIICRLIFIEEIFLEMVVIMSIGSNPFNCIFFIGMKQT